jgi:hypothetical protein
VRNRGTSGLSVEPKGISKDGRLGFGGNNWLNIFFSESRMQSDVFDRLAAFHQVFAEKIDWDGDVRSSQFALFDYSKDMLSDKQPP